MRANASLAHLEAGMARNRRSCIAPGPVRVNVALAIGRRAYLREGGRSQDGVLLNPGNRKGRFPARSRGPTG